VSATPLPGTAAGQGETGGHRRPVPEGSPAPEAGREPAVPHHRSRARAARRLLLALVLVAAIVAGALRAPSALKDFTTAFAHVRPSRLPWLAAAVGGEFVSFLFYARIQSNLLLAGGARVRLVDLFRLAIASTGLAALLPAGVLPSSGWRYEQYRRINLPPPLSLFAVLASGFVSTVTLLALLLVAAAIAGVGSPALLATSGFVLVAGSAAFVALVHRLEALERRVDGRRGGLATLARRLLAAAEGVAMCRPGWRRGAVTFGDAAGNWLADAVCLVSAFALLGLPIPWRPLLFAYAAAQLAGSIFPLPGGLGAVEGGIVGAFDITGVPVGTALAAAVVYRVINYWGVALIGGIELVSFARHPLAAPVDGERSAGEQPADTPGGAP